MALGAIEEISEKILSEVCAEHWSESQSLDFKRTHPGTGEKDRNEFLKDVCGLANADGGDIVYGISDIDGQADAIHPIVTEPADAARRRLGQIADSSIEPRIPRIRIEPIAVTGGYALVVRVPSSFSGPHCYRINDARRFVIRNGTHTTDLTYDQLRIAFDRTATLTERVRQFIQKRLTIVAARELSKSIRPGPLCAVHLVPIRAMDGRTSIDVAALSYQYTPFMFRDWGGATRSTNLDGLVIHPGVAAGERYVTAYTQVFRSGAFEACRIASARDEDRKSIPSTSVGGFVRDAIGKFATASKNLDISGPAIAHVALLDGRGYQFEITGNYVGDRYELDRQSIVLPEHWIDALEDVEDVDTIVKPLLDVLWQSFDIENCTLYKDGVWSVK